MRMWKVLPLLIVVSSLVLAACGGDDDPSPEEARANLCDSLENLRTQLAGLTDLSVDSTVDQVQDAEEAVQEAWDEVVDAAQDVEDAEIDQLEGAIDDLESTISDLGDDTTIADALSSVQQAVQVVGAAFEQLFSATDCTA